MTLIWATRGRTWGFRFLCDGGYYDPLPVYDDLFQNVEGDAEVWRRVAEKGALRFLDPLERRDRASRIIPHDFVVFGPMVERIDSVEDGLRLIWPLVADDFARVVGLPKPPSPTADMSEAIRRRVPRGSATGAELRRLGRPHPGGGVDDPPPGRPPHLDGADRAHGA